MERREVVNASNGNILADEWAFSASAGTSAGQPHETEAPITQFPANPAAGRSLCLYFGPSGERCYQQALDNGFCKRHQPNASPTTASGDESRARRKKAAATLGILAALWPLIEELLRQIFRLLR
ncbi:MAG TPA: hypothetical protein VJR26_10985 [Candidatus Acidoferrales bacterium]|nr:hypothetical protein [Candidatus Acidoferrales bacterium]